MIEFEALRLRSTPNQYLVAPENLCREAVPHRISPLYAVNRMLLCEAWESVIARQPRITHAEADEARLMFELVQRTAFFRFPDRITVQFFDAGSNRSTLAIYSRSRYGRRDFGKNRKRIDLWLEALNEIVPQFR